MINSFLALLISLGVMVGLGRYFSKPVTRGRAVLAAATVKTFTAADLSRFDGTNPDMPIYLALDGNVYDISSGRDYYKLGGPYHSLAGKDSSAELHLIGGDIIKRKYPIIGIFIPQR